MEKGETGAICGFLEARGVKMMTMSRLPALLGCLLFMSWASLGMAEDRHAAHMAMNGTPQEAGQGAFAAIAEIVAMLEADPETDWSKVRIAALREHLVDMSEVTLQASVAEEALADGLAMMVTGTARTLEAIQRMVPTHAAELDAMQGWSAAAETTAEGAKLTVTSSDPAMQVKIKGLGFYGLLATGSHHQAHHLAIARGEAVHQHH
jgi:hypothetical protein